MPRPLALHGIFGSSNREPFPAAADYRGTEAGCINCIHVHHAKGGSDSVHRLSGIELVLDQLLETENAQGNWPIA